MLLNYNLVISQLEAQSKTMQITFKEQTEPNGKKNEKIIVQTSNYSQP